MKIADICSADTGGQSFKLSRAITEYTEHTSRSFRKANNYLDFPGDITSNSFDKDFVTKYMAEVDIIHCHNMYRYANGWGKINPNAKWLIHQHGRLGDDKSLKAYESADKQRGAKRFVSTINLLRYVHDDPSRWIPAPIRVSEFDQLKAQFYNPVDPINKVRIAHSPTNRNYKNTDLLIEIISKIPRAELVLIEGKPNKECLELRASCDITFDQMHLCYGNSGLEGMAFRQPTIVGMDDSVRKDINSIVGYEPFIYATPGTLEQVIKDLVYDEELRMKWGNVGRKYIEDWHDDKKIAIKMIEIYKNL